MELLLLITLIIMDVSGIILVATGIYYGNEINILAGLLLLVLSDIKYLHYKLKDNDVVR